MLFLAQRHGGAKSIEHSASLGPALSTCADFRLRDAAEYERWYAETHPAPSGCQASSTASPSDIVTS